MEFNTIVKEFNKRFSVETRYMTGILLCPDDDGYGPHIICSVKKGRKARIEGEIEQNPWKLREIEPEQYLDLYCEILKKCSLKEKVLVGGKERRRKIYIPFYLLEYFVESLARKFHVVELQKLKDTKIKSILEPYIEECLDFESFRMEEF